MLNYAEMMDTLQAEILRLKRKGETIDQKIADLAEEGRFIADRITSLERAITALMDAYSPG